MAKGKHYKDGGNRPELNKVLQTITAALLLAKAIADLIADIAK